MRQSKPPTWVYWGPLVAVLVQEQWGQAVQWHGEQCDLALAVALLAGLRHGAGAGLMAGAVAGLASGFAAGGAALAFFVSRALAGVVAGTAKGAVQGRSLAGQVLMVGLAVLGTEAVFAVAYPKILGDGSWLPKVLRTAALTVAASLPLAWLVGLGRQDEERWL